MKRHFVHEYAFGYMNSYSSVVSSQDLMRGGTMDKDIELNLSKCHIYFICTRPSFYFIKETIKHENNVLSGEVGYKINGIEKRLKFNRDWVLEDGANEITCEYPFREINSINNAGERVRYVPASMIGTLNTDTYDYYSEIHSYDVIYIGRAIGTKGNRNAIDRLKSHSTLQKILSEVHYEEPDKEIKIFMFAFDNEYVFSSMDGRSGLLNDGDNDNSRFNNAINNKPTKNQSVIMIEAALIKFFEPKYNIQLKTSKISPSLKALKKCYDIDMSGLVVEVRTEEIGCCFYSKKIQKRTHHIINIDLVSHQERLSFFRPTGFNKIPDVIE